MLLSRSRDFFYLLVHLMSFLRFVTFQTIMDSANYQLQLYIVHNLVLNAPLDYNVRVKIT